MIEIKSISAVATYDIRKEILRKNIQLTEKIRGDFDEATLHLGVFTNDKLVCVSTFLQNSHNSFEGLQYRLAGMATLSESQKQGFGKKIVLEAVRILKKRKVAVLWCNARIVALDFYKKLGFDIKGEEFDIPLIGGHFIMFKNL